MPAPARSAITVAISSSTMRQRSALPGVEEKRGSVAGRPDVIRCRPSAPAPGWGWRGTGAYCGTMAGAPFRNTYFWIFPVAVLGSSGTNCTPCGALKCARRSRAKAIKSSGVASAPSLRTMNAKGASPHLGCGRPTMAASWTAGWRSKAPSTSTEEMFSPPLMITSLMRSRIST